MAQTIRLRCSIFMEPHRAGLVADFGIPVLLEFMNCAADRANHRDQKNRCFIKSRYLD
jgi:hypothetical protein